MRTGCCAFGAEGGVTGRRMCWGEEKSPYHIAQRAWEALPQGIFANNEASENAAKQSEAKRNVEAEARREWVSSHTK